MLRGERGRVLLDIPEFSLQPGQRLGIRGPSGAGKSTLLFALAGLSEAASGRVIWDGVDLLALSPSDRAAFRAECTGFVFQDFLPFEELGSLGNAAISALFAPRRTRETITTRASDALTRLGLHPNRTSVTHMSGGERQRVAMARALANAPTILLADEPTPNLHREAANAPSEDRIKGPVWGTHDEAIVGAQVPLEVGDVFKPAHGFGSHMHEVDLKVVGRLPPTGRPWDRAILVPIEAVWGLHGLADGHAPATAGQLGPPFDPAYFPGTPAVIVRAKRLAATYALQSDFTREAETMAIFPGAVLANLHRIMGDVRQAMSLMALVSQILVAVSVLLGLFILTHLFRRQIALMRALGAPTRFILSVVWLYAAILLIAGGLSGCGIGYGAAAILSDIVSARTEMAISTSPGWSEIHSVAAFAGLAALLCIAPALAALRQPTVRLLRS